MEGAITAVLFLWGSEEKKRLHKSLPLIPGLDVDRLVALW